jgi:tetratricopeptide (TPR) repeat protein
MKKLIIGILSLLVLTVSVDAQDAKKAIKNAEKALKEFMKDPATNAAAAKTALATLEAEFGTPDKGEHYIKKADLYMEITESEEKVKLLNPGYALSVPDAPVKAMESYKMALSIGDKEKDALNGIEKSMGYINNIGVEKFELKDYKGSFMAYDMVTQAHKLLASKDKESTLSDPAALNQHMFYTAVAGYYAGLTDEIVPYLEPLYEEKYDHSFVYEALFNATKDSSPEEAKKYLQEGRERYPEETGLLYAEINYYLSKGELEIPIDRIKMAISKDPENITLYTTLGNVYDQLTSSSRDEGNLEKADEYFNEAFTYFNKAKEIDPENFDASYSVGALYYNKAASMTEEINELANDYSAEGSKMYNEKKKEMDGYFDEALPYFEKAHMIDSKDRNSIIALREIYARKNMFDKVEEMKKQLEALGG